MTFRKALVDTRTNIVLNVTEVAKDSMTEIDGKPLIPCDDQVGIGDVYDPVGKTFTRPAPPPEKVPERVSALRFRLALNAAGLRDAVEQAVKAAGGDAVDLWEYAADIERAHKMVIQIAGAIGVTSTQLDDLFLSAQSADV